MILPEYIKVKTTTGRIEKGILSIPVSLRHIFPLVRQDIFLMLDNSRRLYSKSFSPYESSTRECRINGLHKWFTKHNAKGDEEVVITVIDRDRSIYRLSFEVNFISQAEALEKQFLTSPTDNEAEKNIEKVTFWTGLERMTFSLDEYKNLSALDQDEIRKLLLIKEKNIREKTTSSIKLIFYDIYDGKCQLCRFTFRKKDGKNYFEMHHIDPRKGHIIKNLLAVCANCHRQFEYAKVNYTFDRKNWLRQVKFNNITNTVKYIISPENI